MIDTNSASNKLITYGLIGHPLDHSFSKKYFENKFLKEKITNCNYELFPIPQISQLENILNDYPSIAGFNVTIPYKESIIKFLDEIDPTAAAIGAVNTVKVSQLNGTRHLVGYNTDASGFQESLSPLLTSSHKNALVLGSGGAAKAVEYVLKELNIKSTIVSRTPKNKQFSYNELTLNIISVNNLIINTTPVGTFPNVTDILPLPFEHITKEHLLIDLIYNPSETAFMRAGKKRGASVMNGLTMLELQAEKAWNIWNQL